MNANAKFSKGIKLNSHKNNEKVANAQFSKSHHRQWHMLTKVECITGSIQHHRQHRASQAAYRESQAPRWQMAVPGKTKPGKMELAMDKDVHEGEPGKAEEHRWRGAGGGAPTPVEDHGRRAARAAWSPAGRGALMPNPNKHRTGLGR